MRQFDVVTYAGTPAVVVETDDLPQDYRIVVIPLMQNYPAVSRLNPVIDHDGQPHVLATRLIISVRRSELSRTGINVADYRDDIVRAMDTMIGTW